MKLRRKLLCLALSVLMVFSVCGALMTSAETTFRVDSGDESGVVYNSTTYNSCNIHTLAFDTDDYVVVPFSGYSGGTYILSGQYSEAVARGYDVVGIINGDFFNMSNGQLNDYIVTNGEVIVGDSGRHSSFGGMTCIMPDGSFQTVAASQLKFTTYFNGVAVPGGISYVNRRPNRTGADGWTNSLYYFDSTSASDKCPLEGVAVLCKKLNGTVLAIGGTLDAQVISVEERSNANGIAIAKDEFLLYVRSTSSLAATLKALKSGDSVTVTTSETVEASVDITTNATSILSNIGYLVKDGKNFAATDEFNKIDPHGNTYLAAWTAFGVKDDGSWMFFISEATNKLTQPQVAEYMISQGCKDVIRLDGGGSVAMYLSNNGNGTADFAYNQGRHVPDCLMVVKRSSAALQVSDETRSTLKDLMEKAKASTDEDAKAALKYAQSVLDNKKSVSGDYIKAIMRLQEALNDKGISANIALGKSYKIGYGTNNATYNAKLTDGVASTGLSYQPDEWFGFVASNTENDVGTVTIDLGDNYVIDYATVHTYFGNTGDGVVTPASMKIEVSSDGTNYTALGKEVTYEKPAQGPGFATEWISFTGETPITARYVKLTVVKQGAFAFLNEIEVYGVPVKEEETGKPSLGDLDGNGEIDAADYAIVKKVVLGTFKLPEELFKFADIDGNGEIDAADYGMVKRAAMGTFTITAPNA